MRNDLYWSNLLLNESVLKVAHLLTNALRDAANTQVNEKSPGTTAIHVCKAAASETGWTQITQLIQSPNTELGKKLNRLFWNTV